ncbi:MAG: thioredoxin domain-containing protein [Alphaproteobacteria bacterium]|nr:thioredoxin domain-containing protein [Alphaproteobacteria bacterium]
MSRYRVPASLPVALAPLLACGTGAPPPSDGAAHAPGVTDGAATVARWEDGRIELAEVEARVHDELRRMDVQHALARYELLHDALDVLVDDQLLRREVERRALPDREALLVAEVDSQVVEPTEDELREEYDRFSRQVPSASFEAARPHIRREILEARKAARRTAYLRELHASAGLRLLLEFPDIPRVTLPIETHDPVLGPDDAPVTIVEFAGFQCYYCKRVQHVLTQLVDDYEGKVRVVFKDFPLAGHTRAEEAAVAAHCADEQGRFWEMATLMLDNQALLDHDHLRGYADRVQLDVAAWARCMEEDRWPQALHADVVAGREAGVTSTPTFFVNGLMISGAHDYARYASLVDQELERLGRR